MLGGSIDMALYMFIVLWLLGSVLYTIIVTATTVTKNDSKVATSNAILNIGIVSGISALLMGGASYYFYSSEEYYDIYLMLVVHVTLFIVIMSSSISALNQLTV
jgi:uncharacterized membrane protein